MEQSVISVNYGGEPMNTYSQLEEIKQIQEGGNILMLPRVQSV